MDSGDLKRLKNLVEKRLDIETAYQISRGLRWQEATASWHSVEGMGETIGMTIQQRSMNQELPMQAIAVPNIDGKQAPGLIKIAVIGDVHDQWEAVDGLALQQLGIDLALFVGDFGNESVEIVRAIAALDIPKAVIFGNHDAWYSASHWGKQKCPYDRSKEDRVQQQFDLLGDLHVGYGKRDFPDLNLTVVGARPFSWGGSEWKNPEFYQAHYGIHNFAESTAQIVAAADQAAYNTIIFLGHCGPFGLGDRPDDPCGKDLQRRSIRCVNRAKPFLWLPLGICITTCAIPNNPSGHRSWLAQKQLFTSTRRLFPALFKPIRRANAIFLWFIYSTALSCNRPSSG